LSNVLASPPVVAMSDDKGSKFTCWEKTCAKILSIKDLLTLNWHSVSWRTYYRFRKFQLVCSSYCPNDFSAAAIQENVFVMSSSTAVYIWGSKQGVDQRLNNTIFNSIQRIAVGSNTPSFLHVPQRRRLLSMKARDKMGRPRWRPASNALAFQRHQWWLESIIR
jgi:hypothetical protein